MNVEALLAIGALTLILGGLLYIPGRLYAKRVVRETIAQKKRLARITPAGVLFAACMVAVLIFVFSFRFLAPESWLGQFMSTKIGLLLAGVSVALPFSLLAKVLSRFVGIQLAVYDSSAAQQSVYGLLPQAQVKLTSDRGE